VKGERVEARGVGGERRVKAIFLDTQIDPSVSLSLSLSHTHTHSLSLPCGGPLVVGFHHRYPPLWGGERLCPLCQAA
jgi:hypothetical protein